MFELANYPLLLLLPLPLVLWYFLPKAEVRGPSALKVPFFSAVKHIAKKDDPSLKQQHALILPLLIWVLLVMALSGPRWIGVPRPLERDGYNIMMAIDLSGSMEIPDMILHGQTISRLSVVKKAASQFVRDRYGDKIGLILFGTRAYLQTPLTYDRHTVLMRIEDATAGLAGKTTSIGDAIGLAVKRLNNAPHKARIIILLTDGANNSGVLLPLKAAELAKQEGIKIYTIGLGSESYPQALNNPFLMQNTAADLDEDTLKEIATMTKGRYFRATDSQTLQSIYSTINQLETTRQEQATVRPQKEYYPWLVGIALLLCLFWFSNMAALLNVGKAIFTKREAIK